MTSLHFHFLSTRRGISGVIICDHVGVIELVLVPFLLLLCLLVLTLFLDFWTII